MTAKTKNLNLSIFDFATDSTGDFVNGVAGLTDSNMHKIDEAITNKVKIDGESTDIEMNQSKVAQDGVIESYDYVPVKTSTGIILSSDKCYSLTMKCLMSSMTGVENYIIGNQEALSSGFYIRKKADNKLQIFNIADGSSSVSSEKEVPKSFVLTVVIESYSKVKAYVNGELYCSIDNLKSSSINLALNSSGTWQDATNYPTITNAYIYDRKLTPIEIQYNFSALSDVSNINRINGKLLSTNTHHVKTPSGVSEEERYTGLLKTMCKEFTSDGSNITVNNGIPNQKILSGEIKGRTVRNYCPTISAENAYGTIENNYIIVNHVVGTLNVPQIKTGNALKPSTEYDIVVLVKQDINNSLYIYGDSGTSFNFTKQKVNPTNGISVITKTTISDISSATKDLKFAVMSEEPDAQIIFTCMIFEKGIGNYITSYLPFGLNYTNAIINDNSIYEPNINGKTIAMKATKGTQNWEEIDASEARDNVKYDYKLVGINDDLGSTPSSYDYIDRARKVKVINTKEVVFDGSEDEGWIKNSSELTNTLYFVSKNLSAVGSGYGAKICAISDKYKGETPNNAQSVTDEESVSCYDSVRIRILKSKLSSQDTASFKKYLQSNPITVRYQLATPIEVPLTDEEISQYDQYRKVIELGGVGDVCDTFEIKEDGSGVLTKQIKNTFFNGSENWFMDVVGDNTIRFRVILSDANKPNGTSISNICDKFPSMVSTSNWSLDIESVTIDPQNVLSIRINKTKLSSPDLTGFKLWLSQNVTNVNYILATPIITHIPKELVPQILTQFKNDFSFGNGVKPSSVKISVPIDKVTEIEARLQTFENLLMDIVLDK